MKIPPASAMRRTTALIAEIDTTELTLRIAEIACAFTRPPGIPASVTLGHLRSAQPGIVETFDRMAIEAIGYVTECINKGRQPS